MYNECKYLFVYGKLKHDQVNEHAAYLSQNAYRMGNGYVLGRIYLINNEYPGLILSDNPDEKIYGDVYKVHDNFIFSKLDKYEKAWPETKKKSEYKRIIEKVYFGVNVISCWMYVYNKLVNEENIIENNLF